MIRRLLFFAFATQLQICIALYAQAGINFSSPIIVSSGNTYHYTRPRIVLDANNEPVILWGNPNTKSIYVSTFTGTGFTTPQQVNPAGSTPYIASWYNADLKSSGNTLVVVYPNTPGGTGVFMVKSTDGGDTWSAATRVDNVPADNIAYYPSCALNENGDISVAFMRHDASWTNPRYVVTTSTDGGATFMPDVNASAAAGTEVCDCCPAYMMYRNDEQVLLFRNNNSNIREFYAAVSQDNGASFDSINVDLQAWNLSSCPSSAPGAMFYGDSLVSVFMSGASGGNRRIYISTAHLQNGQVGYSTMIDPSASGSEVQNFPRIAGEGEIMGLVWQSNISGVQDVYFSYSKTGPQGLLGAGDMISNPATGIQQNPDIAYANGNFHIVYQDNTTKSVVYLKATLDEFMGISEPAEKNISFYLDPSSGLLSLFLPEDLPAGSSVEMMDMKGSILKTTETGTGTCTIDMSAMAAGMYYVKVEGIKKAVKVMK